MQVTVADAGKLRKSVTLSYSAEEFQARRSQVLRTYAHQVKLDGFRPGKSPLSVIEKRFGEAANQTTEEQLADEGLKQALEQHHLSPIGPLNAEAPSRANGFSITVSFDVKPTIEIPEAKSFSVTPAVVEVSDSDLAEQLNQLARRAGTMSPLSADETVIEDDSITVSGTVKVGGAEVRQLHDFNHLVGGYPFFGKAPAEVIAACKDKKVGETLTFTSTLPASFTPAEYQGKEAEISVTIQAANRLRAAALDDEFAKKLGAESLEALKTTFRLRLQSSKESEARGKQVTELTDQLLAKIAVELPEQLRTNALKDAVAEAEKGKTGEAAEKAKADAIADTEKGLKRFLILDALASKLGIQVTNDDFEDQIRMAAFHTGRNPTDIAKQLKSSGKVNQVAMEIREAKAVDTLLDQVLEAQKGSASAKG